MNCHWPPRLRPNPRKHNSVHRLHDPLATAGLKTASSKELKVLASKVSAMCGIYGIAALNTKSPASEASLEAMGRVVAHRGPDDEGRHCEDGVALGMRRLSIIDIAGGHQPIPNEDETVWVICNGEIYNYKELRNRLESRGHVFRCNSDS